MYNIIYNMVRIQLWGGGSCTRRAVLYARGRSCDVPTGLNGLFLFLAYYYTEAFRRPDNNGCNIYIYMFTAAKGLRRVVSC